MSIASTTRTPEIRARGTAPAGRLARGDLAGEVGFEYTPHELTLFDALAPPTACELEILREYIDLGRGVIGRTAKS